MTISKNFIIKNELLYAFVHFFLSNIWENPPTIIKNPIPIPIVRIWVPASRPTGTAYFLDVRVHTLFVFLKQSLLKTCPFVEFWRTCIYMTTAITIHKKSQYPAIKSGYSYFFVGSNFMVNSHRPVRLRHDPIDWGFLECWYVLHKIAEPHFLLWMSHTLGWRH